MRVDRKRIWNRSRSDWKAILAVIAKRMRRSECIDNR
jgi:hypothetical protein